MKIRIAFAAIALFALASAFTTRNLAAHNYKFIADATTRFQVEQADLVAGTGTGQYSCDNTSATCVVNTTTSLVYQDQFNCNFYVDKNADVTTTSGAITIH